MTSAERIATAYPAVMSVIDAFIAVAGRLGANPVDLANLIQFESGWNPAAKNPTTGASGLIQFMPSTARGLGTTVEEIRGLSVAAQLPLVERYLAPYRGQLGTTQALFMAVFYPAAMAWPAGQTFPANVQKANPGIRTPRDYVTKALGHARISSFSADYPTTLPLMLLPTAATARPWWIAAAGLGMLLLALLLHRAFARAKLAT